MRLPWTQPAAPIAPPSANGRPFRLSFDLEIGNNARLTVLAPDPDMERRAEALREERTAMIERWEAEDATEERAEKESAEFRPKLTDLIVEATVRALGKEGETWREYPPAEMLRSAGLQRVIGNVFELVFFRGAPQVRVRGLE